MKDDQPYLLHILDAVDQAILYASEGRALFDADRKTREAAKRVSAEFRRTHPEVPWKGMAGLRDRLFTSISGSTTGEFGRS